MLPNLDNFKPYAKAIVAFFTSFGGAYALALPDGITGGEWVAIIAATGVATFGVFITPNTDPKAEHQEESVQPPPVTAVNPPQDSVQPPKVMP